MKDPYVVVVWCVIVFIVVAIVGCNAVVLKDHKRNYSFVDDGESYERHIGVPFE